MSDAGGANYGLELHKQDFLTPGGRGVVIDPPDGKLPTQPWAAAEAHQPRAARARLRRPDRALLRRRRAAFDVRALAAPDRADPGHIVILFERMSWRIIPLDTQPHLPDTIRLWQGDSVGRWEGDTLVVETKNLNGKTWLNEVGEIVSHAQTVVERFIPLDDRRITYRATVTDPLVYTRPWTIEIPLHREDDELLEVACHEDDQDLGHLKEVRDAAREARKEKK